MLYKIEGLGFILLGISVWIWLSKHYRNPKKDIFGININAVAFGIALILIGCLLLKSGNTIDVYFNGSQNKGETKIEHNKTNVEIENDSIIRALDSVYNMEHKK
jgi:hypothetical protein